jgi:hypothetical protein
MRAGQYHLSYCLNVHPGEDWAATVENIRTHVKRVREQVCPDAPFGLGMRISAAAAQELTDEPAKLEAFRALLTAENLYVFTINGFPYGQFHNTSVKQDVYAPDWRDEKRVDYTCQLVQVLAALLPEGVAGSISTVPCSYGAWIESVADVRQMAVNLALVAGECHEVLRETGRSITIALEPEPDCYVETTDEVIDFVTGPLATVGAETLRAQLGCSADEAEAILKTHVGMCFDTSHQAVEFESFCHGLQALGDAGVRVAKIHLSSALEFTATPEALAEAKKFVEPVYLHQTQARSADGTVRTWPDLGEALEAGPEADGELWRVHYHVPLFWDGAGVLGSTNRLLDAAFFDAVARAGCEQLEIETYTFTVLPEGLAVSDVCEGIAREFAWVRQQLDD